MLVSDIVRRNAEFFGENEAIVIPDDRTVRCGAALNIRLSPSELSSYLRYVEPRALLTHSHIDDRGLRDGRHPSRRSASAQRATSAMMQE